MCGVRLRMVAAPAVACVALSASACASTLPTGTALVAVAGRSGFEAEAAVGQVLRFGVYIFQTPKGGSMSTIYVRDITLLNVPKGLNIDGVWGERFSHFAPATGVLPAADGVASDVKYGYPPSEIVLDPTCGLAAHCAPTFYGETTRQQDWILVVDAHMSKPGVYATSGFRVVYEVDGQRYQQTIPLIIGIATEGTPQNQG